MWITIEDEARMKIYSVSTRHYYAFGALVFEEVSYKIKELPGVRWVLPDSYLDVKNKDYGGEPFINGQAVMCPNHGDDYTITELNPMEWKCNNVLQVLVPIADGSEEIMIIDILRRAKANVMVASVGDNLEILASRKAKLVADMLLDEAAKLTYDLAVLPGGLGDAQAFAKSDELVNLLKKQAESNKHYGAICASPALVLDSWFTQGNMVTTKYKLFRLYHLLSLLPLNFELSLLCLHLLLFFDYKSQGKRAIAYPAMCDKLSDRSHIDNRVVVDGNLITSRGPGTSMEFALGIVEKFFGRPKALELAKGLLVVRK
ncbi:hypothetical protein J1N35_003981 [Gossypium stocksii]|uniref:DJ-1/PfpI domain-containing protein n=1 Tax=Gossypium stocksii TaxID=47602 RepID=A0A9D3WAV5_9ROSI|nr:hypothetical protein J1N35_003981 [Gossypium stocksii]